VVVYRSNVSAALPLPLPAAMRVRAPPPPRPMLATVVGNMATITVALPNGRTPVSGNDTAVYAQAYAQSLGLPPSQVAVTLDSYNVFFSLGLGQYPLPGTAAGQAALTSALLRALNVTCGLLPPSIGVNASVSMTPAGTAVVSYVEVALNAADLAVVKNCSSTVTGAPTQRRRTLLGPAPSFQSNLAAAGVAVPAVTVASAPVSQPVVTVAVQGSPSASPQALAASLSSNATAAAVVSALAAVGVQVNVTLGVPAQQLLMPPSPPPPPPLFPPAPPPPGCSSNDRVVRRYKIAVIVLAVFLFIFIVLTAVFGADSARVRADLKKKVPMNTAL